MRARRLARAPSEAWWPSVVVIVFLLSSCAGDPGVSSQPASPSSIPSSATASPTQESSRAPAPSDDSQPEPASASDIVQVVADGLQLRSAAGTQAPVVGGLERGAVARIESDPVESDGFVWHEVVDIDGNRGWVASGDDQDPWLAIVSEQAGTSILRYEAFGHVSPPAMMPQVTVMDDRRVVMGDSSGGWRVAHLTDVGFDRLSESVLESPYLQASAEYEPVLRAGVSEGPPHGQGVYRFTLGTEAEPIVVRSVQWFGEEEEAAFFEPSPERRALDGIAEGMSGFEEALGPDAWVADPLPYVGGSFIVWVGPGIGAEPPDIGRVDPSALPSGALGDLVDLPPEGICAELSIAEAFELARVLLEGGGDLALDTFSSTWFAIDDRWFGTSLSPRAPDGYPGCADVGA